MALYSEKPDAGNGYRERMLKEVGQLLAREARRAEAERARFFRPTGATHGAYAASAGRYRRQLAAMLGWPLTLPPSRQPPAARRRFVAEDDLGAIWRLWIRTLPGVDTYGILFLPRTPPPHPLVISQHGGLGTPELCSGFFGSSNYNDMTRRVLGRGMAVFAPQLMLWDPQRYGPAHAKDKVDAQLKQLGGSLAALEVYRLQRCLDYLCARPELDASRVGMIGLSYGGFYTLAAAALDPRIKAAVSSCFFNDRFRYPGLDWTWFGSAQRFFDAEMAALVCPRHLYIEVGRTDPLFAVRGVAREARKVQRVYQRLGLGARFGYKEHEGGHELDKADDGLEFLAKALGVTEPAPGTGPRGPQ